MSKELHIPNGKFSSLNSCTSWLLYQNQWLEIVLHTPQHHGGVLLSLIEW